MLKNSSLSNLSDEELLLSHKESGKNSFVRELFNRYLALIYGVCLNYLEDADNAEDAVMQIYDNLLFKLDDYEITVFRPWIYDFTKKHCLQLQGKEDHSVVADSDELTAQLDKIIDLFESNDNRQITLLTDCLKELPQPQRISVNYFFKDKLSYAEIADKADYTLKHVKKYIRKGKQNLMICIEKTDE